MKAICNTDFRKQLEKGKEYQVEDRREQEFFTGKKQNHSTIYKFVKVLGCRFQESNFTFSE